MWGGAGSNGRRDSKGGKRTVLKEGHRNEPRAPEGARGGPRLEGGHTRMKKALQRRDLSSCLGGGRSWQNGGGGKRKTEEFGEQTSDQKERRGGLPCFKMEKLH